MKKLLAAVFIISLTGCSTLTDMEKINDKEFYILENGHVLWYNWSKILHCTLNKVHDGDELNCHPEKTSGVDESMW